MSKAEMVHLVVDMDMIVSEYMKNVKPRAGKTLSSYEYFYDPAKGKVVLRMVVLSPPLTTES